MINHRKTPPEELKFDFVLIIITLSYGSGQMLQSCPPPPPSSPKPTGTSSLQELAGNSFVIVVDGFTVGVSDASAFVPATITRLPTNKDKPMIEVEINNFILSPPFDNTIKAK